MLTKTIENAKKAFWLLPGFLLWASFPPMGEKMDCLFALAPLIWLARNGNAKTSFRKWFLNGLVFWFATLSWMPAIVKNGGPWPLVVLGWGALAAYCALYFGAFGWFSAKVWAWAKDEGSAWRKPPRWPYARRLFAILVAEPVLWCGLELVRSRLLGGFAWNHLGVPLVNANFCSPAALGGVYALGAVAILVNGTIAGIAERIMKRTSKIAFVETLIPFLTVWGLFALSGHVTHDSRTSRNEPEDGRPLRVAMVQRNFPCVFKSAGMDDPIDVYSNLVANLSCTKSDLLVLPESALSEFGAADSPRSLAFMRWIAEQAGVGEVIAGGGRSADGKEYNSAILYKAGTRDVSLYDKVHLVPFGEFIPGDKWITSLQKLAPVGSCTPGELKLLGGYGVAICYEDTDSAQMRALARMGAKCLVFITNDSWFSNSVEAEQHAWQSVARAVETGLHIVRVGNSGVTGTIAPDGKAQWLADSGGCPLVDARGTMSDAIMPRRPCGIRHATPYARFGDIPLAIAFALLIVASVLIKYIDNHEKRRYLSM